MTYRDITDNIYSIPRKTNQMSEAPDPSQEQLELMEFFRSLCEEIGIEYDEVNFSHMQNPVFMKALEEAIQTQLDYLEREGFVTKDGDTYSYAAPAKEIKID